MTKGKMNYLETFACELKMKGVTSIAMAYMMNTGLTPADGRFKYEFTNITTQELGYLESYFHTLD